MTDAKSPEPSIEEILASIRKIISDDDAEASPAGATPAPTADLSQEQAEDDILELTDEIFTAVSETDEERLPPSNVTILPQPMSTQPSEPQEPSPQAERTGTTESELLSSATIAATSGAIAKLAHIEALDGAGGSRSSGPSVEDLARELLKPMLRQWIDQNLPSIVERLVERELRKITRKAEDL